MATHLFSSYITQHKNHFYSIISKSERSTGKKRYCARNIYSIFLEYIAQNILQAQKQ
jgi:hypothetical protein